MNSEQIQALSLRETDLNGALSRFGGNERLYTECLRMFLADETAGELGTAVAARDWDNAFTAAHALKGLAGNLGFVPLMHSVGQLVIMIRAGRTRDVGEYLSQVNSDYRDICDAIRNNFTKE